MLIVVPSRARSEAVGSRNAEDDQYDATKPHQIDRLSQQDRSTVASKDYPRAPNAAI